MRRRFALLFLLATLLLTPTTAHALEEELEDTLRITLNGYDLSEWQQSYASLSPEVRALWGYESAGELIASYALGEGDIGENLLQGLWEAAVVAVRQGIASLGTVIGVALFIGLLDALLGEGQGSVKEIASFLCYGVCVAVLSGVMAAQLGLAAEAIGDICRLLEAFAPLLATLLAAVGATASAGMAQPLFVFLSGTVAKTVQGLLLPAVMSAGVLHIVGALTGRKQLDHVAGTIKSFAKWMIGGITTVFLGSMALRGMSVGGADSISFRTMKYALDKSLPLVGGVVAGSLDSVRGCTLLIKNAAGIAAVFIALGMVLTPLLRLAGMNLAFRITAALCAQLSDERMPKLLNDLADICRYMFACVAAVALMYVLTMGLIMALGGV
ncbi:MAG: stage III sporulation protein AE [Candidatus Pelethousia sp.]|nr:stage III sporulation protein AE [Candidatus Pelethousia sp.]